MSAWIKMAVIGETNDMLSLCCFREKLRELNNELLKKNAFIDEMEPKYSASCKFGMNVEKVML